MILWKGKRLLHHSILYFDKPPPPKKKKKILIKCVHVQMAYLYARQSIPATDTRDAIYLYVLVVITAISCSRTCLLDAISIRHSGNSARLYMGNKTSLTNIVSPHYGVQYSVNVVISANSPHKLGNFRAVVINISGT